MNLNNIQMKKGDKVKTEIIKGFWFYGTYIDDFPKSDGSVILIESKKMILIADKSECQII